MTSKKNLMISDAVTNIWNIKKQGIKKAFHMFYVELKSKNDNKDIYIIGSLLQYRVKFEPLHSKCEIPQCINCQRYDNTKNFCFRKARCVKCTEDHPTINCPRRERSKDVKCILCENNYPANYKGCMVYKDLQKSFFLTLRRKMVAPESRLPTKPASIQTILVQPGRSYA